MVRRLIRLILKPFKIVYLAFCMPSLEVLVERQLAEAERDLLASESQLDQVTAAVTMYQDRCERLRQQLASIQHSRKPLEK